MLVNIGAWDPTGLLAQGEALWPQDKLPTGELYLRAVLCMDGMPEPIVSNLILPTVGESFGCECTQPTHSLGCTPQPWTRLPITAPGSHTIWTGELVIYYEVVAIHAQRLTLPIGDQHAGSPGPRSTLIHRLTESFDSLGALGGRSAGIVVTNNSRLIVNGVHFASNPVSIMANASDNIARGIRRQLYDISLVPATGGMKSTFDSNQGKDFRSFEANFATLARSGAQIYEGIFRENYVFDTLADLIRKEADARGRPPIVAIADLVENEPSRLPVPWSLIYDLNMPGDPSGSYQVCESLRRFGPGGRGGPVPDRCPEPDHNGPVLCPFGFWGLSCYIEQPASTNAVVRHVLDDDAPVDVLMAIDRNLDHGLTRNHVAKVKRGLGRGSLTDSTISSPIELAACLGPETMDIAYLYCHGGYSEQPTNTSPMAVLRFGDSLIAPVEVAGWRRNQSIWPRPHWPKRKPLVVLNGCHTTELTTATLSNFVDAFVNRAGASGVIGTEVTLEQEVASWACELLLSTLSDGADAGEAVRSMRWEMLKRGNVMGLAYTLHCITGLRLRPRRMSERNKV
ncbi:hypothetical protein [Lentzea californiensis]|uniref:hypothetical protein n=1 Tax=Lentzea californiensis TaxID=438851 RepID=UPI002165957E|nr:hypothetical protein [Lentzea californiensis]